MTDSLWKASRSTVLLPAEWCLAAERKRLWKALERFVNCGDEIAEFQALSRGFPAFFPVEIYNANSWHLAFHRLFLFYRNTLKHLWSFSKKIRAQKATHQVSHARVMRNAVLWGAEYLAGFSTLNQRAFTAAKSGSAHRFLVPTDLIVSAKAILAEFPKAQIGEANEMGMLWETGSVVPVLLNDFQKAFFLLFLQSWRTRICSICKSYFIADKPGRKFCGPECSRKSRLQTKLAYWNSTGASNRKNRVKAQSRR